MKYECMCGYEMVLVAVGGSCKANRVRSNVVDGKRRFLYANKLFPASSLYRMVANRSELFLTCACLFLWL